MLGRGWMQEGVDAGDAERVWMREGLEGWELVRGLGAGPRVGCWSDAWYPRRVACTALSCTMLIIIMLYGCKK